MVASAFLMLCRYLHLIPNLFNAESLHQFLWQTLPPHTPGEEKFYNEAKIISEYDNNQSWQQYIIKPEVDENDKLAEPALHFHEFLFLLGLIAKNCIKSQKDNTIKNKLVEFYTEKLNFKPVDLNSISEMSYNDVLNQIRDDEYGDERYDRIDGEDMDGDEWGESDNDEL